MSALVKRRFWIYPRAQWDPPHRWLPYLGGDEWGRRTVVLPIPFGGYLVWAFWTCACAECNEMREQTHRWEAEDLFVLDDVAETFGVDLNGDDVA